MLIVHTCTHTCKSIFSSHHCFHAKTCQREGTVPIILNLLSDGLTMLILTFMHECLQSLICTWILPGCMQTLICMQILLQYLQTLQICIWILCKTILQEIRYNFKACLPCAIDGSSARCDISNVMSQGIEQLASGKRISIQARWLYSMSTRK